MKTETQIAKEKIFDWSSNSDSGKINKHIRITLKFGCQEHKQSCQRFLEFLEGLIRFSVDRKEKWKERVLNIDAENQIKEEITDLENAIKSYDNAGI